MRLSNPRRPVNRPGRISGSPSHEVGRSLGQAMPPVVGMLAVMLDHQDAHLVVEDTIVDAEGETPQRALLQIAFDQGPSVGGRLHLGHRRVELPQEAIAETRSARLGELGGLDQLSLGLGVIDQPHPIARRAARTTSSWVRPETAPEVRSASRRAACSMA